MIFDYDTLKIIWWLLLGVLLIGFAVTDGFDMGVGVLLPFLGKNDAERRIIINSVGPTWEGNQVWLITAGAAMFAAWPMVYAAAFSGFYVALLLTLYALFFRPVGFDYRSKLPHARWRNAWDWALFAGSAVPALVFGVAFGNLLQGVPFHFDETLRVYYTGSFWQMLNPFGLLAGIVSVSMLTMHGACFLQLRTEGVVCARAKNAAMVAGAVTITAFALAGLWIATGIDGYKILYMPAQDALPNPLIKMVARAPGAWLDNYHLHSWMMAAPLAAFGAAALAILASRNDWAKTAFLASGVAVTGVILTAGFSMFPFIMPSSSEPNHSLTVWDAASSHRTLQIMFWAVVLILPVVVAYTSWVYSVVRGKITAESIREQEHTSY